MNINSFCVKEVKDPRTTKSHVLPIYPTSSFSFESIDEGIDIFKGNQKGHVYGRYGNPTMEAVAAKVAALESFGMEGVEGTGLMTSSGMSAISTLIAGLLSNGDKVLTQSNLYGGTTEVFNKIFVRFGIENVMIDFSDPDRVESVLKKNPSVKLLYLESPANPTHACVDLKSVAELAKKFNCWTAIDNTFMTPLLQQPFRFGIDFIVHSTTKYLNGHGNSVAGIIIGKDREVMNTKIWKSMVLLGTNCNPWDAWLLHNGLKTLGLRMKKHCENGLAVARFLSNHPKVNYVNYCGLESHPDHELAKRQMSGFGAMMSFELDGGFRAGIDFMNRIEFCTLAPTLGDVDTLIVHPASMSHGNIPKEIRESTGVTDGLIRLSVGIEEPEDICNDLEQALG